MKTSTLPSLRVDSALRNAAEDVLFEGESLSSFVLQSVQANIERRRSQNEFIARGMASRVKARRIDEYVGAREVLTMLEKRLSRAKAKSTRKA